MWWIADKVAYRNIDTYNRAYMGNTVIWDISPENKIFYRTDDENICNLNYDYESFGLRAINNTYVPGVGGVIEFNGPVLHFWDFMFGGRSGGSNKVIDLMIPPLINDLNINFGDIALQNISVHPDNTIFDSRNDCGGVIETSTDILYIGSSGCSVVPYGVKGLMSGAYSYYCDHNLLTSIELPETCTTVDFSCFEHCVNLRTAYMPGVTTISSFAFVDCSLETIYMPVINYIDVSVFRNPSVARLRTVHISSAITNIGDYSFYNQTLLEEIIIDALTPPTLGNDVFTGCSPNLTIRVPAGSVNAYKTAAGWSNYASSIVAQ